MLFLLRITIFALALFLLWRILREYYDTLKERLPRRAEEGKKVVEPRVESFKKGEKMVMRIYLPGVASERDISLRILQESIEVRADGRQESFFKIIPINSKNMVRSKKFEPPVLEIEME